MVGVVLVFHDVTEKRRAQEALLEAHDELEARVRERTIELSQAVAKLESMNQELNFPVFVEMKLSNSLFLDRAAHRTERRTAENGATRDSSEAVRSGPADCFDPLPFFFGLEQFATPLISGIQCHACRLKPGPPCAHTQLG